MLLIGISGSCTNGTNGTLLLLLIQSRGYSWQCHRMCCHWLSTQPGTAPVHSSHPSCHHRQLAWTLLPAPSALPEGFLERLFSKNLLKICNCHTRAEGSHTDLLSPPVRPVPMSSWGLWFPRAAVQLGSKSSEQLQGQGLLLCGSCCWGR